MGGYRYPGAGSGELLFLFETGVYLNHRLILDGYYAGSLFFVKGVTQPCGSNYKPE